MLKLTEEQIENLNILYLAKYYGLDDTSLHPVMGITPHYHNEIANIIKSLGMKIHPSNSIDAIFDHEKKYNYIFSLINVNKFKDSEIFVSALCEYYNIKYLGAPPHIRAIAQDKHLGKIFCKSLNINTPDWITINNYNELEIPKPFEGPYFVKPRFSAGSLGISENNLCAKWSDAKSYAMNLLDKFNYVIIEKFIDGRNITFPVVGGIDINRLRAVENCSDLIGNISTNQQKRLLEKSCNREVLTNSQATENVRNLSQQMFISLKEVDYIRVDYRICSKTKEPYFIELNICCNLGSHSSIAKSALSVGISHESLLSNIIAFSLTRQKFQVN